MEPSSLAAVKASSGARAFEEAQAARRKRDALVLILRHLTDGGYVESARRLEAESGLSLSTWDAADNVDLATALLEYEAYYEFKFGKRPRLSRKVAGDDARGNLGKDARDRQNALPAILRPGAGKPPMQRSRSTDNMPPDAASGSQQARAGRKVHSARESSSASATANQPPNQQQQQQQQPVSSRGARVSGSSSSARHSNFSSSSSSSSSASQSTAGDDEGAAGMGLSVQPAARTAVRPPVGRGGDGAVAAGGQSGSAQQGSGQGDGDFFERRLLKPAASIFGADSELVQLAQVIQRDIYLRNPNVRWSDVAGLDDCKRVLKEAVVMPIRYPQLFTGILAPWKGVLLFGPPGTGKTMLAKAVATECETTFFNISASSIVSKWRGDSEKLVRVLFELARAHAPSTIFIDEMDSIMSQRAGDGTEHEGSRRLKTELLIQMDGLGRSDDLVFVLAATNLPWALDTALLRRLEKRVYVGLPVEAARRSIVEKLLPPARCEPAVDHAALARRLDGYSGSDLALVCKEAAMHPLRRVMDRLETGELDELANESVTLDLVTVDDVDLAVQVTSSTAASGSLARYEEWSKEFGAR
jgi:katanin p60 ATPase-containing subunit A1